MTKETVCERIRAIGILPAIRVPTADDALFAAHQMVKWGIPVVELTMTVPGAIDVIGELVRTMPQLMVGAGTVLNVESAQACLDAGAMFITSPGFDREVVEFTMRNKVASIPGALTPSEVMRAYKAGADLIKIFPCSQFGGPDYLRALRRPFPAARFIASGGVTQQNAAGFLRAEASALGIREELIPAAAIERRDENWLHELAGRFLGIVQRTRVEFGLQ